LNIPIKLLRTDGIKIIDKRESLEAIFSTGEIKSFMF
jgi:hypothetical protein